MLKDKPSEGGLKHNMSNFVGVNIDSHNTLAPMEWQKEKRR